MYAKINQMNDSTHYKIIQSRYTTQNVRILKKKERRKKKRNRVMVQVTVRAMI